jgi:hypothetical protein
MTTETLNLGRLTDELRQARLQYEDAARQECVAHKATTACLTHLNSLQQQIDKTIAGMRQDAPHGSYWQPLIG